MSGLTPYPADVHIHSCLSSCADNSMTPPTVMSKLKQVGTKIFAIADHNACGNSWAFEKACASSELLFIPGIECQTQEEIHVLGFFKTVDDLKRFCESSVDPVLLPLEHDEDRLGEQLLVDEMGNTLGKDNRMLSASLEISIDELAQSISSAGGIVVPSHLDRGFSVISQLGFMPPNLRYDAVEIYNLMNLDEYKEEFIKNDETSILSSSDTHYPDMFKPAKMRFWLEELTIEECFKCIRKQDGRKVTIRKSSSVPQDSKKGKGPAWKVIYGKEK